MSPDVVKWFNVTLTETEKQLNKFYNIRINFAKLRIHIFERLAKTEKNKIISCYKIDKNIFKNVEQVI
jgi:hypothetical protein